MPAPAAPSVLTALQLARTGIGLMYVILPGWATRDRTGQNLAATRVTRALGARHLAQALVTRGQPAAGTLALGGAVDAAHAASMLALGLACGRWRRAALYDAVLAASLAAAGAIAARQASVTPRHDGCRSRSSTAISIRAGR